MKTKTTKKVPTCKRDAIAAAVAVVRSGTPVERAAAEHGVSKSSIYAFFRTNPTGLPDSIPHTRTVSEETLRKVRKVLALQTGKTPLKLMAALRVAGISYNTYLAHWAKVA